MKLSLSSKNNFNLFLLTLFLLVLTILITPSLSLAQNYMLEINTDDNASLNTYNLYIPLETDNSYLDLEEPYIYNHLKLSQSSSNTSIKSSTVSNTLPGTLETRTINSKIDLYDEYFDTYHLIYLENFNLSNLKSNSLILELYNSDESLVSTTNLNFCNNNNICEPCLDKDNCKLSENIFTCPNDCNSGIDDNICDYISDGICDPNCYDSFDPDCINCNEINCISNTKLPLNSCSELSGSLCPISSSCIGGSFINNYDESNLGCCIDGFCDYILELDESSPKESQLLVNPSLDLDYALSNKLPERNITNSKYLSSNYLAYLTFSILLLIILISIIVVLHNGVRKKHISNEFTKIYFEITFYLDKGYTYEQVLNYYVKKKNYDEKFILSVIKKIQEGGDISE